VYWLITWCLLALLLGYVPGGAAAQVTMEARLGLQGALRLGKWNVVTVQVHNAGGAVLGTLGVRTWLGSEARGDFHTTTFTRPVELPPGARKRFTFAVPISGIADPVEVTLRTGETVLAQQRLDLREALHAEQVIVGLTHDVSLDFLATVFQKTHTRVVYLPPDDLPQHWSGYDSVSAVVVKGVSLQALSTEQNTALHEWLANGGTLIAAGDSQYTLLTEPRLRALLPVEVLGLQQVAGLPAFVAHYEVPFPATPTVIVRARLTHGQVLVGTPDAPLLVQRRFGKGRVVFLAVDYAMQPFPGWQGRAALWNEILQTPENVDFARLFAELGMLDETHPIMKLFGRPVLDFPSHLTIVGYLLMYCSLLAVLFWRMSKRQERSWRYWGGVVAVIVAFTLYALSPLLERGLNQPALIFDVTTMELLPETGYAHLHGHLGLFSVRGGQFHLAFQQPETILRHTFTRGVGKAGKDLEASIAGSFSLHNIGLEPWALRVFSTESMALTPVQVTVQPHVAGLTIQVENRGALPLQGATVVYQGRIFVLGAVAPGEAVFDDLYPTLTNAESAQEMTWRVLLKRRPAEADTRLAYLQEVLLQQYFGDKRLAEASETPFLAGWLMAPSTLRPAAAAWPVQGVTLVVSRLAL
jgi:hypothetical protein